MQSETVEVRTPDGTADAYLTRPDGDGDLPGVLFVMDAYGLRPRIDEMADRVADQGYVVLAPNVLYRAGRAPVLPMPDHTDPQSHADFMTSVRPLMSALTPEIIARDSAAYLDFLSDRATGPVGITGYCMGGRFGWRVAAAHPDRVASLGSFHGGGFVTDAPDSPHRSADRLQAELYFGHADQDRSMTPEQIGALERALDEAGANYRSELYEGALHGYTMSDTAVYNEDAAERHFRELFALLERTLDRR